MTFEVVFLNISLFIPFNCLKSPDSPLLKNTCVDSTFAKSRNNKFNVIHEDDVKKKTLIDYYSNKLVDRSELDALRFPARNILNHEDLSNSDKLKYLNKIMKRFDETGANTIPVHDINSIHLL